MALISLCGCEMLSRIPDITVARSAYSCQGETDKQHNICKENVIRNFCKGSKISSGLFCVVYMSFMKISLCTVRTSGLSFET